MIKHLIYEIYKTHWIETHTDTKQRLKTLGSYAIKILEDKEICSIKEYIEEYGYNSECYVSYNEFLENEYQDKNLIKSILEEVEGENGKLYNTYVKEQEQLKEYIFKIHHHSYRTGQKYSTEVGIMKAKNEDEAKEKIWEKYGSDNSSFHDDEIKEIPKEEDTRTFGVLIQGS